MPFKLTVHGGNREIGGNKILVETEDGGLFLDFGKSFDTENQYFEILWNPPFHVPSLLAIRALPDLAGLYRTDAAAHNYAVAVSHAHLDHIGYVPHLAPGTPIITGVDTKNLLDIRFESGQANWETQISHLDWQVARTGDAVDLERLGMRVLPVHVDHSVPASYGFIVEVEGKRIGYTGDLRMHGARADLTEDFLTALREKPLDILLCEGTRLRPAENDADAKFLEEMAAVFRLRMGEDAPRPLKCPAAPSTMCGTRSSLR